MPPKGAIAFVLAGALVPGWVVPTAAPAQPAEVEAHVYMVSRSNPKAPPLDASVTVEWEGDGQHLMIATLDKTRSRYELLTTMYVEAGIDLWPRIHHAGSGGPDCVPSPLCSFPLNSPLVLPVPPDDADVAFVAALGREPKIEVGSPQWTVQAMDPGLFQVVNERSSGSTGIRFTGNYSVSRFTHAALTGGPGGSLAFASIPCDPNQGAGEAVLTGGVPWPPELSSDEFYCVRPNRTFYLAGLAFAPAATEWDFSGDVIGSGAAYDGRLAVLSLPNLGRPVAAE